MESRYLARALELLEILDIGSKRDLVAVLECPALMQVRVVDVLAWDLSNRQNNRQTNAPLRLLVYYARKKVIIFIII